VAATDRVRLLVVTDWDMGFVLTAHPPLPDVAPGESYVTEFVPQRPVTLREVLVEGFSLVQISIAGLAIMGSILEQGLDKDGPRRLYRLEEPVEIGIDVGARVHLLNASAVPRKQKIVTLVRDTERAR
jgi:hypothetical protein